VATDVKAYFCDPQSPWQRGSNENTNGLLRQYFPRRTDLSGYTQADLDQEALRLNQRPRKTLGFKPPPVNFNKVLHRPFELTRITGQMVLAATFPVHEVEGMLLE
jgi:IS30 family transposase